MAMAQNPLASLSRQRDKTKVSDETLTLVWPVEGLKLYAPRNKPFVFSCPIPSLRYSWSLEMTHTWDGHQLSLIFQARLVALLIGGQFPNSSNLTASVQIGVMNLAYGMEHGAFADDAHQSLNSLALWRVGFTKKMELHLFCTSEEDFRAKTDGRLLLLCTVRIPKDQSTYATPPAPMPILDADTTRELRGRCKLSANFKALLDEGVMTDACIVCAGNQQTFHVHKVILAARSPVFAAMFNSHMSEAQKNEIVIQDFEAQTVDAMIRYIYSGSLTEETWSVEILNLLRIADKYQLLHLKEECEKGFEQELNVTNVCEFLAVAHLFSQARLMPIMVKFINSNRDAVMAKEEVKIFLKENPDLLLNLYMSKLGVKGCPASV